MRARSFDTRQLGVAVSSLAVGGAALALDRLERGWHRLKRSEDGRAWRWTDGCALIPADGARRLDVGIDMAAPRWVEPLDAMVSGALAA